MAGLTFLELQAAVMGDRFRENQRGDVKSWINSTYWSAWSAERWTFRYATDLVTVTAGSNAVSGIAADVERVDSFQTSTGVRLQYLNPRRFEVDYYNAVSPSTGAPEAYTIIAGAVYVGPVSSESRSDYLMTYEKAYTALVNDGDVPLLPEGSQFSVLVFGAQALGLKLQNDFTWQFAEQTYMAGMDALRSDYLSDESDDDSVYPADPIGVW